MDWIVQIGLVGRAAGLGDGGSRREAGVADADRHRRPQRVRQVHLDYLMMSLILIGVGLAVPDLPSAIAVGLVFGTLVNPFLVVPLAFRPDTDTRESGAAVSSPSRNRRDRLVE